MKFFKFIFSVSLVTVLSVLSLDVAASIEILGSLKHIDKAKPGDVIKGEVRIRNNDNADQEVKIYLTDLKYDQQDKTFYNEPGSHKRSNANWIQFSPRTAVLKGKEVKTIQYEITVPKDDSLRGTFWSILMVEGVIPVDQAQKGDLSIRTVTRYAIQVVTELADKGKGAIKFIEPELIREGKKIFLAVDLLNTGDHYISPDVSIELFDDSGATIRVIHAPTKGLYPSTSSRFKFDLKGIPGGRIYKSTIVAAGLEKDVFEFPYKLNLQ